MNFADTPDIFVNALESKEDTFFDCEEFDYDEGDCSGGSSGGVGDS